MNTLHECLEHRSKVAEETRFYIATSLYASKTQPEVSSPSFITHFQKVVQKTRFELVEYTDFQQRLGPVQWNIRSAKNKFERGAAQNSITRFKDTFFLKKKDSRNAGHHSFVVYFK